MGIHRGPNPVKDGLVFGYDTGYGIADNNTATRFYPGKPVTNSINGGANRANAIASPSLGSHGAAVTTELISYGNRKNVFRIYSTNTSGYYMVNQQSSIINTSGNVYTYSFDYKKIRGTSTSFSPSAIYKNGYKSPDSGSAASNLTDTIVDLEDGWKRLTRTYTSTYTGYNLYRTNLNTNDTLDFEYLFDNFMVNEGAAVPFVDGTRSSTASLIDLKKTTDIDVSNVSFDSTGQPTFDGTDDYIQLGNTLNSLGSVATFDMVFKSSETNDTYRVMIGWGHGNNNYSSIALGNLAGAYSDESAHVILNSSDIQMYVTGIGNSANWKDNKFHHMTVTVGANNYSIWIDGVERSFTFASGSQATSLSQVVGYNSNITAQIGQRTYGGGSGFFKGEIPVMKIHNRILTDDEIKQNYNAYKNRFDI